MKPTIEYVSQRFHEFNRQYFQSRLDELPIALSNAKTFMGKVAYKQKVLPNGQKQYSDFRLLINTRVDINERELEDTILHEMIHYYILSNQLQDTSAHGRLFRQMMNYFNEQYGRHITISKKVTQEERQQLRGTKPARHIFVLIEMQDGSRFVKVVPRLVPRICQVHRALSADRRITHIQWYYAESAYLNAFPSSTSNKIFKYDETEMALVLAHPRTLKLRCDGRQVTQMRNGGYF